MFGDRKAAGRLLAERLETMRLDRPVVLALPRGGVPVALEVARALKAPLDLVMVRKLGVPSQPELAAGAVVNGDHPQLVVNEDVASHARLNRADLERIAQRELQEIKRRRAVYFRNRAQMPVAGRTAIIVDDGIATGATIRAAIKGTRQRTPARIVLAVPVAAWDTLERLRSDVDDIVCVETPESLYAIGVHYLDFTQVSDDAVVDMLEEADRLVTKAPTARR
jgi:putative phosphoribosyl transferase